MKKVKSCSIHLGQVLIIFPHFFFVLIFIFFKVHDFPLGNDFLATTPKAQMTKQKNIKFIKSKDFCESKDMISR